MHTGVLQSGLVSSLLSRTVNELNPVLRAPPTPHEETLSAQFSMSLAGLCVFLSVAVLRV